MSKDSGSDEGSSSSWWSHGSQQNGVDNFLEGFVLVFVFVPSSLIQKLSDQFDGWLGSIFLFRGHVEIVNKEDAETLGFGSVLSFSDFIQLPINDVLGLNG